MLPTVGRLVVTRTGVVGEAEDIDRAAAELGDSVKALTVLAWL